MSPYQQALLAYIWVWALSHLCGFFLGFVVLETPYGTSTIRAKLVRSLRTAGAMFSAAVIFVLCYGEPHPWEAQCAAIATLVGVHTLLLYVAGDFRGSTLD